MPGKVINPASPTQSGVTANVIALPVGQTFSAYVFITSDPAGMNEVLANRGAPVTFPGSASAQNTPGMSYTPPTTVNAASGSNGNWFGWVQVGAGVAPNIVPIAVSSGVQGVVVTLGSVTINSVNWVT